MNGHDEYLELLAASIDFGLTEDEVARLNYHLASCPECRRAATELRGQNAVIATTPIAPLAPARSEQILRAALRKPATKPRWGMLAVAALLATLGGGVLFAGFQLIDDDDPAPDRSPPIVAEVSAPPSEAPTEESADPGAPPPVDGPRVTPNPGDDEPPPVKPVDFDFPLKPIDDTGPIRVAPAPNDQLWVSFTYDSDTVVALLDATGKGRPWVVPFARDCMPHAAPDGSVRLVCLYNDDPACADDCGEERLYAFSSDGEELSGFPRTLGGGFPASIDHQHAAMVDDRLVLTGYEAFADDEPGSGERWLIEVASNGDVTLGSRVPAPLTCCSVGPDGVAYGSTPVYPEDDSEVMTELVAFDEHGMRPGWPVVVDGTASSPSFGPNGQLVYSSWIDEGSRISRRNADGSEAAPPVDLPASIEWAPDIDGPMPPLVDENGRAWIVADRAILGFDSDGGALDGFPYEPQTALLEQGSDCGPGDTGCQSWIEPPRIAPRGLVYALETGPNGGGGRITVVNPDGSVRSGWPKTLQRDGARWDSVTIGDNRAAYAVAIEPEPGKGFSESILALAPNGSRNWIKTLVEP